MMASKFTDQQYLTKDQYKDSSNLDARIALHQRFSVNPQGWYHWVFDTLVKLPADAKLLELGCGAGTMWQECRDRVPAGWVITLTDLSDGMLDTAWRNLAPTGRAFKFEQMDAQFIQYEDQFFNVIIANHMLYHVPDRPKALAEIKRVLKDDGRLIATTVGENHIKEMKSWIDRATVLPEDAPSSKPFTLENGLAQLQSFFSKVDLARYADGLKVKEIGPIMAYIRSSIRAADVPEDGLELIGRELTSILKKVGEIFITKDSGLFQAVK